MDRSQPLLTPLVVFGLLATAVFGCDSGPPLAEVHGTVKYQGKIVPTGTITFHGEKGMIYLAPIKEDGAYEFWTPRQGSGIAPGNYRVTIEAVEVVFSGPRAQSVTDEGKYPPPRRKLLVPAKYGDLSKTPLEFEVKLGQQNVIDIDLPK